MTESQKNSITSPAQGLLIYQTDATEGFYYYNTSSWQSVNQADSDADPNNEMELPTSGTVGDIIYWDGDAWASLPASSNEGVTLQMTNSVPTWVLPPNEPTNIAATPGNTTATVDYTAPIYTGAEVIVGYTTTATPGGEIASIAQAGSGSITVPNLNNGTAYTFTVRATFSNGILSAPSAISNSVTPRTVPDAPTNIIASSPAPGEATIFVGAPGATGATQVGTLFVICRVAPSLLEAVKLTQAVPSQ
jgi:hypothetical protein